MPLPSTVHFDQLLTGVIVGAENTELVAGEVLESVPSANLTGKIAKMGEDHFRINFDARRAKTPAFEVDYDVSSVSFEALEYAVEYPVDDQDKAQYDDPFDALADGAFVCEHKIMTRLEDLVATLLTTAANYSAASKDATSRDWNVPATGVPVSDVSVGIEAIQDKTALPASMIHGVCSHKVFRWLRLNDEVKESYLATSPGEGSLGVMNKEKVALALGLASLTVGSAIKITSKKGVTAVKAPIWGTDKFLIYGKSGGRVNRLRPELGFIIRPTIEGFPSGINALVDRYRRERIKSDVVRATGMIDQVIANDQFGFLYDDIL